ncbi:MULTISPECIES: hypothetical protein [Microbacterium]|uniref:Uncharacterized protein n=1 Tax=Microbacterium resistens TaxID=156977 RepID=A0ABY3RRA9_9MICO|nr:hypothetical protein [Microbacterium resistens]MBW1638811.1 hypothetical protein [Microbacterium resistens]MDA4892734.1 hypothetical protein [Streptomyces sp. MS2A]UGS25256.1 hypothetical protein K8F61_11195 [Microbacterium resistens]
MIGSFIIFGVLFLGGFALLGNAQNFPGFESLAFIGGILLVSLALAWMMRERGGATKRSRSWE